MTQPFYLYVFTQVKWKHTQIYIQMFTEVLFEITTTTKTLKATQISIRR